MSAVRYLLDRLQKLDAEIAECRATLLVDDLSDSARESARVTHGMLLFARAKTITELHRSGWRPGTPEQRDLL